MKIRIESNSIRIRLDDSEVQRLAIGELLEERLEIGPQAMVISLQAAGGIPCLGASFDQGHLKVLAPADQVQMWATSDQVGIEISQPTGPGPAILIIVERDLMPRRKRE